MKKKRTKTWTPSKFFQRGQSVETPDGNGIYLKKHGKTGVWCFKGSVTGPMVSYPMKVMIELNAPEGYKK